LRDSRSEETRPDVTDRPRRISGLSGVAAVALWAVGIAIIGGDHIGIPGGVPEEGGEETLAYFRDNADRVQGGSWLFMIGSLLFIWFAATLPTRLLGNDRPAGAAAPAAFAGGVATGIFALGMPAGGLVASLAADEISASTAEALNGVEMVFFLGAELAAVLLLVGSATLSLRTRALPRWWAVITILLAVWLLIAPIGWLGLLLGVPIWTLVTAGLLITESRHPAS
jgi:hypothetical protein